MYFFQDFLSPLHEVNMIFFSPAISGKSSKMERSGKNSVACGLALIKTHQCLVLKIVIIANILPQILVYIELSGQLAVPLDA